MHKMMDTHAEGRLGRMEINRHLYGEIHEVEEVVNPLALLFKVETINGSPLPSNSFTHDIIFSKCQEAPGKISVNSHFIIEFQCLLEFSARVVVENVVQQIHQVNYLYGHAVVVSYIMSTKGRLEIIDRECEEEKNTVQKVQGEMCISPVIALDTHAARSEKVKGSSSQENKRDLPMNTISHFKWSKPLQP